MIYPRRRGPISKVYPYVRGPTEERRVTVGDPSSPTLYCLDVSFVRRRSQNCIWDCKQIKISWYSSTREFRLQRTPVSPLLSLTKTKGHVIMSLVHSYSESRSMNFFNDMKWILIMDTLKFSWLPAIDSFYSLLVQETGSLRGRLYKIYTWRYKCFYLHIFMTNVVIVIVFWLSLDLSGRCPLTNLYTSTCVIL